MTTARHETSSHPGSPIRAASPRQMSGDPGPAPVTPRSTDLRARAVARRRPPWGRKHIMAAKPKPQSNDDARELARRALQTSMDTRQ